jgi:hypothetical protein
MSRRPLTTILLQMRATNDTISVGELLNRMGENSFPALLIAPALILFSPLSVIPGVPTIGAIIMVLIIGQRAFGRHHIWMPNWLCKRTLSGTRLNKALNWLCGPVGWIERKSQKRFKLLTSKPVNALTYTLIAAISCVLPVLELLPFVTSLFSLTILLLAGGMLMRDGLLTLIAMAWCTFTVTFVFYLIS